MAFNNNTSQDLRKDGDKQTTKYVITMLQTERGAKEGREKVIDVRERGSVLSEHMNVLLGPAEDEKKLSI